MNLLKLFRTSFLALSLILMGCGPGENGTVEPEPPGNEPDPNPEPTPDPTEDPAPTETFSISGTITVADNIGYDFDVNDPTSNTGLQNNNSIANAQPLGNAMKVYGFASNTDDEKDFYSVNLNAGDKVGLLLADSFEGDLDLHLRNFDGINLEDSSFDSDEDELVIAPYTGSFIIEVEAVSGAVNYNLFTGAKTPSTISKHSSLNFMPGQSIVKYHSGVSASAANSATTASGFKMSALAGASDRLMLMAIESAPTSFATSHANLNSASLEKRKSIAAIKSMNLQSNVMAASPNYINTAFATTPNDSNYNLQWHYDLINLPDAWDTTTGTPASGDVIVAVVDTGVITSHPDLDGKLVAGYDFIQCYQAVGICSGVGDMALDGNGIDSDANDPGDRDINSGGGGAANTGSWHGTHVAGTVAAESNNSQGGAGVSWGAKIMPIRVLGKGGGLDYDIAQGVRFAAGLSNDSGTTPTQAADIINLSLGCSGGCYNAAVEADYLAARAAGSIIIAAAGNDNTSIASHPAAYSGVVSVSSISWDSGIIKSNFSNYGTTVDIAAPGGSTNVDVDGDFFIYDDAILSAFASQNGSITPVYEVLQGTSMAAPHVAGVAALMKAVNPAMTPDDFDNWLAAGDLTQDTGGDGANVRNNNFGYGMIDANKAVLHAQSQAGPPPSTTISSTVTSMDFGTGTNSLSFTISKSGSDTLDLIVTDNSTWLSVTADTVNGENVGSYNVAVDRNGLGMGTHNGAITVHDNNGHVSDLNIAVSVTEAVAAETTSGQLGQIYLLLMNSDNNEVKQEVSINLNTGSASYEFVNVETGSYQVKGGTDFDDDKFVCDQGEACESSNTINLDSDKTVDLEFDGENSASSTNNLNRSDNQSNFQRIRH